MKNEKERIQVKENHEFRIRKEVVWLTKFRLWSCCGSNFEAIKVSNAFISINDALLNLVLEYGRKRLSSWNLHEERTLWVGHYSEKQETFSIEIRKSNSFSFLTIFLPLVNRKVVQSKQQQANSLFTTRHWKHIWNVIVSLVWRKIIPIIKLERNSF